jgi:hypothetical protein
MSDYLNLEYYLNGYFNHLFNTQNTSFHSSGTNFKTFLGTPPELTQSGEAKQSQLTLNIPLEEKKEIVIKELFQEFYSNSIPEFDGVRINLKIKSVDFQERTKKCDVYFINIEYSLHQKKEKKWS